ncbi:MAG: sulfite exporter TauE/SafE family protein [Candidatus Melainabacteria bacterium]|nr:sulfite exporter TauE/SafE family protein [Candidatus Melainabacteria bacterium]
MILEPIFIIKAIVIGLLTGLMSGCFGVGGGILCTPLIRIFLDIDPHVAVGTTMALIIPTSIAGAYNYLKRKQVDRVMASKLAPTAVLGTIAGAAATQYVEGQVLMLLFALLVCVAGIDLSFSIGDNLKIHRKKETVSEEITTLEPKTHEANTTKSTTTPPAEDGSSSQGIGPFAVGLAAGLFAGFFGVGGGFLMVPCLLYFYHFGVKAAFGTSLLVIAAVAIPGTLSHFVLLHVNIALAVLMIAGSIPGSLAGSALALKLKDSFLRRGFGIIMLIMSAVLAMRELLPPLPNKMGI